MADSTFADALGPYLRAPDSGFDDAALRGIRGTPLVSNDYAAAIVPPRKLAGDYGFE
jgi:hypothetical protein